MRGGGVDVDGVGLWQVSDAGARADLDLGVRAKIGGGARGDVRRDLIGDHPARRSDELSEDRRVITGAGADLQDRLARLHAECVDRLRVQRRLAVVDAALGVDGDEDVLVEARGVVGRGVRPNRPPGPIRHGGGPAKSSRGTAAKAASILGSWRRPSCDLGRIGVAFRNWVRHAVLPPFEPSVTLSRLEPLRIDLRRFQTEHGVHDGCHLEVRCNEGRSGDHHIGHGVRLRPANVRRRHGDRSRCGAGEHARRPSAPVRRLISGKAPGPAGSRLTIMLTMKRDGSIFGKPRITFSHLEGDKEARQAFVDAVERAVEACLPFRITPSLGGAIAGRPFVISLGRPKAEQRI